MKFRTAVVLAIAVLIAFLLAYASGRFSRALPLVAPAGVELEPIQSIRPWEAGLLLWMTGVEGLDAVHTVDVYRMIYSVPSRDGNSTKMSGLLALPRGVAARRLVSFQHGTTTTRTAVPSAPDGTGIAAAVVFAGNGYAVVVPDYPGLGVSQGRHPYYIADAIAPSITEMIKAAKRVPGVPHAPVFLAGFSEGAWASLAALRLLETEGHVVFGSAQVAGPYDLRHISLPAAMKGTSRSSSLYLAYAAWGQSEYLGHRLDSVFTPEFAAKVEILFENGDPQEIMSGLPKDPRQLFNSDYLNAFDTGGVHWLLESMSANSLHRVTPRAPVRMYHGSKDMDVTPRDAMATAAAMRARGADVEFVDVGPFEHDPSMLAAAPLILDWLNALERNAEQ